MSAEPKAVSTKAKDKQSFKIATICDEHYVAPLAVMLVSLCESNLSDAINVSVLVPSGTPTDAFDDIMPLIESYDCGLNIYIIGRDRVSELPVPPGPLTPSVYLKLLIGEALPNETDRVVYLDADTLIRGSLRELWNSSLSGAVVAAVPDYAMMNARGPFSDARNKLGLREDVAYFNAGVLLIDLKLWRENDVGMEALEFARENTNRLSLAEQCALNWVLCDRWKPLPETWNLQTHAVTRSRWGFMDYTREQKIRAMKAKIAHFTTPSKPWKYMNNHPLKPEYTRYLKRIPFRNQPYEDYTWRNAIRKNLYRFLPFALGIHYSLRDRSPLWRRITGNPLRRSSAA